METKRKEFEEAIEKAKAFENGIGKAFALLQANSDLKPIEMCELIGGLLFLKHLDHQLDRQNQIAEVVMEAGTSNRS